MRTLLAVLAVSIVGCASGYRIDPGTEGSFVGFESVPEDESRVLFYRPSIFLGDGVALRLTVEDCTFVIGPRQFATCDIPAGEFTVTAINNIAVGNAQPGRWTCFRVSVQRSRDFIPEIDCDEIAETLVQDRQVWTSQMPQESLRKPGPEWETQPGRIPSR